MDAENEEEEEDRGDESMKNSDKGCRNVSSVNIVVKGDEWGCTYSVCEFDL